MIDREKTAAEESSTCEETRAERCYRPNVDIVEKENELYLVADVPGAVADKIDVDFADGILTVFAPIEHAAEGERRYLRREFGKGDFRRSFRIGEQIDPSAITADCSDGVLTLHLPKAEAIKPRKIAVHAG
jgi:HSP20 family molecular chaperone IbpA